MRFTNAKKKRSFNVQFDPKYSVIFMYFEHAHAKKEKKTEKE